MRNFILLISLLPLAAYAVDWGVLEPAPLSMPGRAGPAHASKTFIAEVPLENGQAQLTLPLDTPANALLVVFDDQPLTLRGGNDTALQKREFNEPALARMNIPSVGTRVDLAPLARGTQTLRIESARREGVLRYAVAQPDSPLALVVQAQPLTARPGDAVTLTADLSSAPVHQAWVRAQAAGAGAVLLRDNGAGADARAGDGIYSARLIAPPARGLEQLRIRIEANGTLAGNTPFARTASTGVMLSPSQATLGAVQTGPDNLRIPVHGAPGRYRLEVIYGADGAGLAWARDTLVLDSATTSGERDKNATIRQLKRQNPGLPGTALVTLPRPAVAATADQAVIRLLNVDTLAMESERVVALKPLASSIATTQQRKPHTLPTSKARAAARYGAVPAHTTR